MVITGALDFFTTSRSGESLEPNLGSPASLAAWAARASGVQVLAVITAAAPMTALRTRNDLRSIPSGRFAVAGTSGASGVSLEFGSVVIVCFGLIFFVDCRDR